MVLVDFLLIHSSQIYRGDFRVGTGNREDVRRSWHRSCFDALRGRKACFAAAFLHFGSPQLLRAHSKITRIGSSTITATTIIFLSLLS